MHAPAFRAEVSRPAWSGEITKRGGRNQTKPNGATPEVQQKAHWSMQGQRLPAPLFQGLQPDPLR
jgi:hypothetical protein